MRRFLGEKLPDYMVPSTFVTLETFPLTASGKVNRRALPPPDLARPELETVFVAPQTPVEEVLAEMWARVLGIDRVGIHDDFFESGGHSLLATQLVNRIRKAFRVDLPLRALFEAPTVAALSQVMIANEAEPGQTEKAAQILIKIYRMSSDEIEKMLEEKRKGLPNE
jgi:acyl carrier protein